MFLDPRFDKIQRGRGRFSRCGGLLVKAASLRYVRTRSGYHEFKVQSFPELRRCAHSEYVRERGGAFTAGGVTLSYRVVLLQGAAL